MAHRTALTLAILAAAVMGINAALHQACALRPRPESSAGALLPPQVARVLSGAHRPWLADVSWLRAVEHQGNPAMQAQGHPHLVPLLERVVTLDPYFAGAYQFLAVAADYSGPQYSAAMALLERGMQHCPEAWRIAFFSGFNAYYYARDYPRAARHLAIAAQSKAAPPHTAALATRLFAEAGLPEVGLQLVDTLMEQTGDDEARKTLQQRRLQLELEMQLQTLGALTQARTQSHPQEPRTWAALIEAGAIDRLPIDPFGATLLWENNAVTSVHDDQRLRLSPAARGREQGAPRASR